MITDAIRAPGAIGLATLDRLRRWHTGLGGLFEAERERWLIRY